MIALSFAHLAKIVLSFLLSFLLALFHVHTHIAAALRPW